MIRPKLILWWLMLVWLPVQAGTLEAVEKRGVLRLGYAESKAPFAFKARDDGQPAGYSVELCRRVAAAVAARLNRPSLRLEWVALQPDSRLDAVADGRVDLECGTTTATMTRRAQVDFSLPIFVDSATLMSRLDIASGLAALQGKRIAVAEATTTLTALTQTLARERVQAEVVRTATLAQAFALLKDGRVDAIAGDRITLVGVYLLEGRGDGYGVLADSLSYEPYALALRRGDADFRLLVDRTLADLYRSGEINGIYQQWLGPLGPPSAALVTMFLLNALPE